MFLQAPSEIYLGRGLLTKFHNPLSFLMIQFINRRILRNFSQALIFHSLYLFYSIFLFLSSLRNLIPRHPHQPFHIPVQPVQRFLARSSLWRNLYQFRPTAAFAPFFFQYFSYFTHQATSFSPAISFAFSITLSLYRTTSFIISFSVAFMYFSIYSQSGI